MASNLYETLGLSRDATPDQIRKAYRKKALETHPDRLPQGASPAQKSASEEMFRKVNNAYEILSDPDNRKAYDQYGVWPPPTAQQSYTQGNWQGPTRDPFQDPFFQDPFFRHPFFGHSRQADSFFPSSRHPQFHDFTDPFVLFNRIFGDLHQAFSRDPFGSPFGQRDDGFFGQGFMSPMSSHMMSSPFGFLTGGNANVYSSSSRGALAGGSNGSRWVSESYTTSTVNGVTHTKAVRRDSQGNEHVTYSFPDGTKRRLINGVEQPSNANSNSPPSHHHNRAIAAPPPSQDPPPYEAHVPPPAAGSTRSSRSIHSKSRDYARQPQDPNPTYPMQPQAPYASQYADPNSSGYQKNRSRSGR
ncbi:DnaJ-domain-containing protein [Suillus decipiens]|nr:DnaJ-domain-containing protein [Suillus decipiens]